MAGIQNPVGAYPAAWCLAGARYHASCSIPLHMLRGLPASFDTPSQPQHLSPSQANQPQGTPSPRRPANWRALAWRALTPASAPARFWNLSPPSTSASFVISRARRWRPLKSQTRPSAGIRIRQRHKTPGPGPVANIAAVVIIYNCLLHPHSINAPCHPHPVSTTYHHPSNNPQQQPPKWPPPPPSPATQPTSTSS